ncbi:hypothetical protein Apa02nite_091340 [Actinoplanes palleronii]|uniref:Arsenate reductase n=1 Tax=Actinoplanes palleronii TaxID=113570 RepID=A0ABQ4BQT6_9ACTN|nr:hypothetical protein Apa02nite_091340 [Actinoplanes palleronii]
MPAACTLPTVERPLRLAEFDDLFATTLRSQHRLSATTLRWDLDPVCEATARDLTAQESSCCSFFTFVFEPSDAVLRLDAEVPDAYVEVLDALQQRAADRMRP